VGINLAAFFEWLSQRLKYRPIYDGDLLYLERFYLGRIGRYTFFLHKICASDPDRGIHDHPWNSVSFLLSGSYDEEVLIPVIQSEVDVMSKFYPRGFPSSFGLGRSLTFHRRVRWFNRIPATKFHRLVLIASNPVWTLFVHGQRRKAWGFWRSQSYEVFEEAPPLGEKRGGWFDTAKTKRHYQAEHGRALEG
jgi:hypothetical protein